MRLFEMRRNTPEKAAAYRQRQNESTKRWQRGVRKAVLAYLGGKCVWPGCGWEDERALQVDHVNGGGVRERAKGGHTYALYVQIISGKREGEFQLLCANHNWIKRVEKGEV